jgi:NADPH:quinone reductase-like Zn-dependent oxidoreductase
MRAITVSEYGAEAKLTDMPDPEPGPGQVLVAITAAGVNPIDRSLADGAFEAMIPGTFPFILGTDFAGVIAAVGDGARKFVSGEEVFGQILIAPLGSAGTYAEQVVVNEDAPLARVPDGLDLVVAAALPGAGGTALQIAESLTPLSGKSVLLVGAAGGVGSFATQFLANAGARVIAVARAGAAQRMSAYGAVETIDYTLVSVSDSLRASHPGGVDVLIDVANDVDGFAELASLVRPGGTALTTRSVAAIEGLASREVAGVNFRGDVSSDLLKRLADDVVSGRIVDPPITRLPLDEAPTLGRNTLAPGKTVITIGTRTRS